MQIDVDCNLVMPRCEVGCAVKIIVQGSWSVIRRQSVVQRRVFKERGDRRSLKTTGKLALSAVMCKIL